MTTADIGPPRSEVEVDEFASILGESLNFPPRRDVDFMARYTRSDIRLIRRGGRVAGGLVLIPCGQFIAGQRLTMTGINAVAIAPEARGSGAGRELMSAAVVELAAPGGPPIAVLYPATQPIYRAVGFEQAGTYTLYRVPIASIPVGPHDLAVVRVAADAAAGQEAFGELYRRVAGRENGFVDRTRWFWQRALEPLRNPGTAFAVREGGRMTGYAIVSKRWEARSTPVAEVFCREMLCETPTAARRLWTLLADERSLGRTLLLTGPPTAADYMTFVEQAAEVEMQTRWMVRVMDVEAALAGRGYAGAGQVSLDVADDLVPRNNDRFTVDVSGGVARVGRGGLAGARLTIRGLAALYTGYLTAEQIARAGLASGAPEALAALTSLFAAPAPWLNEIF